MRARFGCNRSLCRWCNSFIEWLCFHASLLFYFQPGMPDSQSLTWSVSFIRSLGGSLSFFCCCCISFMLIGTVCPFLNTFLHVSSVHLVTRAPCSLTVPHKQVHPSIRLIGLSVCLHASMSVLTVSLSSAFCGSACLSRVFVHDETHVRKKRNRLSSRVRCLCLSINGCNSKCTLRFTLSPAVRVDFVFEGQTCPRFRKSDPQSVYMRVDDFDFWTATFFF